MTSSIGAALTWAAIAYRIARRAPQIIALFAELLMIFAPDKVDRKIERVRDEAIDKLNRILEWARRAVRELEVMDFSPVATSEREQKLQRFLELERRVAANARLLGHELSVTDARTIAQNAVKLERSEAIVAPT